MFDVKKHLIKVQGNRLYLPVSARLVWFRQEHPDWGIETRPVTIDTERQYAVFEASVLNADGKLMAKGTKMEDARGFADYIEKAETGAIGRALAVCGFGTQFAPDLDEVDGGRTVDAPQPYVRSDRAGAHGSGRFDSGGYSRSQSARPASTSRVASDHAGPAGRSAENGHTADTGLPDANKPALSITGDSSDHQCAGCGRGLTKGQELLSIRKFGLGLCPDCQRERRTAEAAA